MTGSCTEMAVCDVFLIDAKQYWMLPQYANATMAAIALPIQPQLVEFHPTILKHICKSELNI